MSALSESEYAFQMQQLEQEREASGRAYLQFLDVESLHCGVYSLRAGATDHQEPHAEDEVYYVQNGKAKFSLDGEDIDVAEGSVLFVPAKMEHRFHSIEEDLVLLVFFSKSKPAEQNSIP